MHNKYLKICLIITVIITNAFINVNFALAAGTQTSSLSKGLIAWFPLNSSTKQSATTFADKSPYARKGTITAGASAGLSTDQKGQVAGAYDFDGSATYITLPASNIMLPNPSTVTISVWVKIDTIDANDRRVFAAQRGAGQSYMSIGLLTSNNFIWIYPSGATMALTSGSNTIVTGQWYHLVMVKYGNINTGYVNGVQDFTDTLAYSINPSTDVFQIGALNGTTFFDGRISDLRVYNRVLSAAEVKNLYKSYNAGIQTSSGITGSLLARYSLAKVDNNSSGKQIDLSGNAHTGTITAGVGGFANNKFNQPNSAYDFDKANTKIDTGSDWIGTSAISVSVWFYMDSWGEAWDGFGYYSHIISNGKFFLGVGGITPGNRVWSASDGAYWRSLSGSISLNRWYHLVYTRTSAGVANFYINGVLSGTANQNDRTPVAGTTNVIIGNLSAQSTTFDGRISDLRVYNRVLTAGEAKNLYNSYKPPQQTNSLDKGLIGWFPLNSSTKQSATTFADKSPYARKGTITAGASAGLSADQKGLAGGAYDFDGANTLITTPSNWINASGALSISSWIYATGYGETASYFGRILDTPMIFGIIDTSGGRIGYQNTTAVYSADSSIALNKWYHVVATKTSGNLVNLYINGVLSGNANQDTGAPTASGATIIGNNAGQTRSFSGRISDLRVWNRVLTAAEVMNLYKGSK